jgi:hypothetical protein
MLVAMAGLAATVPVTGVTGSGDNRGVNEDLFHRLIKERLKWDFQK